MPDKRNLKIGRLVREHLGAIVGYCESHPDELLRLMDRKYSLSVFKLGYAFFGEVARIKAEEKLYIRYWRDPCWISGKEFLVCSQWIERSRPYFVAYLFEKNLIDAEEASEMSTDYSWLRAGSPKQGRSVPIWQPAVNTMVQVNENRQVLREERLFTLTVRVEEDLAALHVLEAMRAAAGRAGRDNGDFRFRYEDGLLTLTAKANGLGPNNDLRFRYEDGLLTLTAKADDLAIVRVLNSVRSSVTREDSNGKKELRFEGEGETLKITVRVNDFDALRVLGAVTSALSAIDHDSIIPSAARSSASDDAPGMKDLERGSIPSTIRSFLRERGEAGATRDEINRVVFEATGRSEADTGRSLASLVYTSHVFKVREMTSEGYSVDLYKLATHR